MQQIPQIFDRKQVQRQRSRAAAGFSQHDFLIREATERLAERLDEMTHRFPFALNLGCHNGLLAEMIGMRGGVQNLVYADISQAMAHQAKGTKFVCDEEYLPIRSEALDLVFSALSLHWVNDLPGALLQINQALKPDGLLLAMMFGGQTLNELREALTQATLEIEGGAAAYISPFVDVKDAGSLLGRAGFSLPVVDSETLTVSYENMFALMKDLRGMGEGNALLHRRKYPMRQATFFRAAEIYQERFSDHEGRIIATFELVTLTGWKPHASQQQPSKRGSGQVSLHEVFK